MEIVVTARVRALVRLLEAWDGQVEPPAGVEAVIHECEPRMTDATHRSLVEAARQDLGDVPLVLTGLSTLDPEEVRRLSARLAWTVRTLCDLGPDTDKPELRLEAALISAAFWDGAGGFWEAARPQLNGRRIVAMVLPAVVRSRIPQTQVPPDAPVWEREHLRALEEVEQTCDWARLGELAQAFPHMPRLDVSAAQALYGVAALDRPKLIRIVDEVESWMHGYMLLGPLPLGEAIRISTASRSPHARFAAMERVVRRERRTLSLEAEAALRDLLIVLAKDLTEWPSWLAMCNRYPVRNPHVQSALGRALARSSDGALRAYVDSIALSTLGGDGRAAVTRCLTVFRSQANARRRRALWLRAFERWREWDFNVADRNSNLNAISTTEIDYAVVGWLVEGESPEAESDPDTEFAQGLHELERGWHPSFTAAISTFFRLLSRHQVAAHAMERSADGDDWLPGSVVYVPPSASNPFMQRRYRWSGL